MNLAYSLIQYYIFTEEGSRFVDLYKIKKRIFSNVDKEVCPQIPIFTVNLVRRSAFRMKIYKETQELIFLYFCFLFLFGNTAIQ